MASGRPKGGLGSRGHDKPMGVADGSFPIDPFQKGTTCLRKDMSDVVLNVLGWHGRTMASNLSDIGLG